MEGFGAVLTHERCVRPTCGTMGCFATGTRNTMRTPCRQVANNVAQLLQLCLHGLQLRS